MTIEVTVGGMAGGEQVSHAQHSGRVDWDSLGGEAQFPNTLQKLPEGWLGGAAYGSICIQEGQPGSLVSVGYVWVAGAFITKIKTSIPQDWIDYSNSRKVTSSGDHHFSSDIHRSWRPRLIGPDSCESCYT